MDFYYGQNLNWCDFICILQQAKGAEPWRPLQVGTPVVRIDLGKIDVSLSFMSLEPKADSFKQSIGGLRCVHDAKAGILTFESGVDGPDTCLVFADPEACATFHDLVARLLLRSDLMSDHPAQNH